MSDRKFLAFGDLQARERTTGSKPTDDGLTTYLHELRDTLTWIREEVSNNQITDVICGGDVFEYPSFIETPAFGIVFDGLRDIVRLCRKDSIRFRVILGNHDIKFYNKSGRGIIHTIPFLQDYMEKYEDDLPVLDYSRNYKGSENILYGMSDEIARHGIVFLHSDIQGYGYATGKIEESGIEIDMLPQVPIVAHHYHTPGLVHLGGHEVYVVGSPMFHSFSDNWTRSTAEIGGRGVMIGEKIGDKWNISWLVNPHTSIYNTINIKQPIDIPTKFSTIARNLLHRTFAGINLRLKLSHGVDYKRISDLVSIEEEKSDLGDRLNIVITKPPTLSVSVEDETDNNVTRDTKDVIREYIESDENLTQDMKGSIDKLCSIGLKCLESSVTGIENSITKLNFKSVQVKNFLSLGEVSFDLDSNKIIGVVGSNYDDEAYESNGVGKSALFESIVWALYGKTLRGVTASDICNFYVDGACEVSVVFERGNSICRVTRRRTKSQTTAEVEINGEVISGTLTQIEPRIEEIIGISFEEFVNCVVMSNDKPIGSSPRLFIHLGEADQKRIIQSLAAPYDFDLARNKASLEVDRLSSDLSAKQKQVEVLLAEKFGIEQTIPSLKSMIEHLATGYESRRNSLNLELSSCMAEQSAEEKRKQANVDLISASGDKLKGVQTEYDDTLKRQNQLKDKWRELIHDRATRESNVERLESDRKRIEDLTTARNCITCGQPIVITDELLNDYQKRIAEFDNQIMEGQESFNEVELDLSSITEEIKEQDARVEQAKRELDSFRENTVLVYEKEIAIIDSKLNNLLQQIDAKKNEVASLDKEQEKLEGYRKELKGKENRIVGIEREVQIIKKELLIVEHSINLWSYWKQAFGPSGIRSAFLQRAISIMNEELSRLSHLLLGKDSVVVSLKSKLKSGEDRNKLEIGVNTQGQSYKGSSSGQRDRVNLLLQLSLTGLFDKVRGGCNLLVLDEVASHMDPTGLSQVMELLEGLDKTIVVITHHPVMQSRLDCIWRVSLQNNVATLEVA